MTTESVMVDIPMCVYNHEPFIAQAIEGVLMQNVNFKFRIIIGEDCSTDNSRDVIRKYLDGNEDKIEVIFHQKNVGAQENSRILLSKCTAKYIALLDGDDYWTDPNKLQKQIDFLEANEDFACHCHDAEIIEDNKFVRLYNEGKEDKVLTSDDIVVTLGIPTASVVFRNCLKPLPDYLKKFSLDIIIYFAISRFGKFYQSNEVMSAYRIHNGGMWNGQDLLTKMDKNLDIKRFYLTEMPLTGKQRKLVMQQIVNTRLNRLKYFANTQFLHINYLKDLSFLILKKLSGFKFSVKFFIFCIMPDSVINVIKRN
jgi:glycosyltransferase involved in cell wall biosynthesis